MGYVIRKYPPANRGKEGETREFPMKDLETIISDHMGNRYFSKEVILEKADYVRGLIDSFEGLTESDKADVFIYVSGFIQLVSEIDELFRSGGLPRKFRTYYDANPKAMQIDRITFGILKGRNNNKYRLDADELQQASDYADFLEALIDDLNDWQTNVVVKTKSKRRSH